MKLTREQQKALRRTRFYCALRNLPALIGVRVRLTAVLPEEWLLPTVTSRALTLPCVDACQEGILGLPNSKCEFGCVRQEREVVAITATTNEEHEIKKIFWPAHLK